MIKRINTKLNDLNSSVGKDLYLIWNKVVLLNGIWVHLILQREITFVTSYLLLWIVKPFQKEVCSSKEEFAHKELILPFRSYPKCRKGAKMKMAEFWPLKAYPSTRNWLCYMRTLVSKTRRDEGRGRLRLTVFKSIFTNIKSYTKKFINMNSWLFQ